MTQLETGERESIRVHALTKMLYDVGGKWGPTSLLLLLAIGCIGWGIAQLARGKE